MKAVLAQTSGKYGVPEQSSLWDVQRILNEEDGVPAKATLAKLKSMKRRGVIDGCTCGCRGDFRLKAR